MKKFNDGEKIFIMISIALFSAVALTTAEAEGPQIQVAGKLVVDLDARKINEGTDIWKNTANQGDFKRIGTPKLEAVGGQNAISFDGIGDAYRGPVAPESILGAKPRSVEIWVFNPDVDAPEETMIAWGKRGGPNGANYSFNYGTSPGFGAATHWASDLGWETIPTAGKWHHLVYTFDGGMVRIYDNTIEQGAKEARLNTAAGETIDLAVQNGSDGQPQFNNFADGSMLSGSLAIAVVRVHTGALTKDQIAANYNADAQRFGAVIAPSFAEALANASRFSDESLNLTLMPDTQTVAALSPKESDFDFTPGDRIKGRLGSNFHHLGDLSFRTRSGAEPWKSFSSANSPASAKIIESDTGPCADLTLTMGPNCPISVERRWLKVDGRLVMRFALKNESDRPIEIGSLGFAMVFNNEFTGRHLDETHEKCSFSDPYIGGGSGYLQVTRVNGEGPALLVMPEMGTSFEAYRPLREDPVPLGVTFEGYYEWMAHIKAYAENEWRQAKQWNTPTSRILKSGEEATYGFEFALSPTIRNIENTLIACKKPVVIGIPGYVIPTDQTGRLFINYQKSVKSMEMEPAGAVSAIEDAKLTKSVWVAYTIKGLKIGWCRITLTYSDGRQQFIHYNVIPPQSEQIRRVAAFHENKQWYSDPKDPFKRTDSYMFWDRQDNKMLLQERNTWNAGLSDECGAGPNLLMAMKNQLTPDSNQVKQLEQYVDHALWGNLQYKENYGVRASLFFYEPDLLPDYKYTVRGGWDRQRTETTWRAYNYPHQAAVYWSLYKLARNYKGLVKAHPWEWYLTQAYKTGLALRDNCGPDDFLRLEQFGLMDGSVFVDILKDLRREGWIKEADEYEAYMKTRADIWKSLKYPFGSEMPWDSTGQEEVYQWCKYFGYLDKAKISLNAIVAYTPTVPNWAYNGSSRRYFDSMVYGKLPGIFRGCHHYGASLNSIPLLDAFRDNPTDIHLLRAGYAGANGVLTNIDNNGASSMLFAADPAIMDYEPYSGDYGCAFFGHAYNAGAYVYKDAEFGWLGFGCNVKSAGNNVKIMPIDSFRKRIFVAPIKLWLTLDAGTFDHVELNTKTNKVTIWLAPATRYALKALLYVSGKYRPAAKLPSNRGGYVVELGKVVTRVTLRP